MKRVAKKSRIKKYYDKYKHLAYDLAHLQWFSIKSRERIVGFDLTDLLQEARLQLCLSLSNRAVEEKKLLPYCYLTIKRRLINFTIYTADLVRTPYWKHYDRYIKAKSGENDEYEIIHDDFFSYVGTDLCHGGESNHLNKLVNCKENYSEFNDYIIGLMKYAEKKFSHYIHKDMYLDIFLNLIVVKIKYNNEKDILHSLSEKYGIKEYRVWNIFRRMKRLMIEDAEIIDNLLGTSCFTKLKNGRNRKK